MLCILYITAVGTLLGVAGVLIERLLPVASSRRWVWCVTIPISIVLPGYYRWHHNWSVVGALEQNQSLIAPRGSLTLLDPAWWSRIDACGPLVNNVWLIASGLLLVWTLVNAIRISEIVNADTADETESSNRVVLDGVAAVVTDKVGPATIGLWRSRVVVPRWVLALPSIQRRYVLRHEEEHRRSYDPHLLFVASLSILLMPWNLAMWWQLKRLCLAVEMDCDNRVVRSLGDAHQYGELLFKVAQVTRGRPPLQPAFLGAGMLERRLTALVAPTPVRRVQRMMLATVAVANLGVVLWMPHPVVGTHSHGAASSATTSAR
jgi:beta-lactamase regulating signal transducer with metallopeptidase domain